MAPAAAFATVLDSYLDHAPVRDTAAAGRSTFCSVATPSLFWFQGASPAAPRTVPGLEAARRGGSPADRQEAVSPLRLVRPIRQPAARVPRVLSPTQREALDRLIGLGARIDDTFTLQELRSEFRALARLYHPDRQAARRPSSLPATSRFIALRQAYDVLRAA
jgi:hypothetical protein